MDLSPNKIPYNPPVSPNSPNYNPSYSTYFDPNEDPSYHFRFNTPTYTRDENGGPRGDVSGSYSYMDDAGEWHNVAFEAGSNTGFHIKSPFPDSTPFGGLFFTGPDGRPSGPPRGRTSIQRSVDGSYRFTSSGPDQRRTEVSDAQGNVRGSYTYLDDKGVQRSVHYIAGPNIGYKIINKGVGPSASPFSPSSRPDYSLPKPSRPSRPNKIPEPPSSYDEGLFGASPVGKPSTSQNKPPFDGDFAENSPPTVGSHADDFLSDSKNPLIGEEESLDPQYTPCCDDKPDGDKNSKESFLGGSITDPSSTAKPLNQPESEFLPPLSAFPEDDPSAANKNSVSLDDDFLKKPFSSLPPPVRESRFYGSKSFGDNQQPENYNQQPNPFYINDFSDSDKKFSGFPPGVSVKARIQSLDIRPFGSRIPPPGIALEHNSDSHSRT